MCLISSLAIQAFHNITGSVAGAGAGGRSAVQLVRGSDEVSAGGGESGRAHSHRVSSEDGTTSHLRSDAAYSRARGDTEVR